ncbi:MAG: hypothetical protein ACTSVV_05390, partial [Promethearchaeota archaeon]
EYSETNKLNKNFITILKDTIINNYINCQEIDGNMVYTVIIGRIKELVLKKLNINIENMFEKLFEKNNNKYFKVIEKNIGFPIFPNGLDSDPSKRIYKIQFI